MRALAYTIPWILIFLVFAGAVFARREEKREWNSGVCRKSGKPWKLFDTDSQGGRGYTDGEGNYCWISYSMDGPKRETP